MAEDIDEFEDTFCIFVFKKFENEFKPYYSDRGVPIRTMVGYLLLKRLYNLGDERIPEY